MPCFLFENKYKCLDFVNYPLNTFRSSSMLGVGWRYGLQIGRRGGGGVSCSGQLIVRLVHGKKKSQVIRAFSGSVTTSMEVRNRKPCSFNETVRPVKKIMKVVPLDWPLRVYKWCRCKKKFVLFYFWFAWKNLLTGTLGLSFVRTLVVADMKNFFLFILYVFSKFLFTSCKNYSTKTAKVVLLVSLCEGCARCFKKLIFFYISFAFKVLSHFRAKHRQCNVLQIRRCSAHLRTFQTSPANGIWLNSGACRLDSARWLQKIVHENN